jgi:ATP-dependent RNA helicase DDX56/DBP9
MSWLQRASWLCAGLDRRLVAATQQLGFVSPTLVQTQAIPLALQGRDLLVRAKTGSGKTAAYALSALQRVLVHKAEVSSREAALFVLVLVPSRELVQQTVVMIEALSHYCRDVISVVSLASGSEASQRESLSRGCDVVVGTPARVAALLSAGALSLGALEMLVVDEADLVLSYGHGDEIRSIVRQLPRVVQGLLVSATLSPEVEDLKRLVLHSPAILKLEDSGEDGLLTQWVVSVSHEDRFLLLYALVKLKLIAGRAIFFVNDLDSGYRLKLFLEAFGIRAAVLNSELPANSRAHILHQFHQGAFQFLVATDESFGVDQDASEDEEEEEEEDDDEEEQEVEAAPERAASSVAKRPRDESDTQRASAKRTKVAVSTKEEMKRKERLKRLRRDLEYGVARGVDFRGVGTIVNVDFPPTVQSYIHRIGRTARAGASGAALSFLSAADGKEAAIVERLRATQPPTVEGTPQPAELPFDRREVAGFRYRVRQVLDGIKSSKVIREARAAELRNELLNSEKLRAHFEDNPDDLRVLRHDAPLLPSRVRAELTSVPAYLLPTSMRAAVEAAETSKRPKRREDSGGEGDSAAPAAVVDPLKEYAKNAAKMRVGSSGVPKVRNTAFTVGGGGASRSSNAGRTQWKMRHKKGQFSHKHNPKKKEGSSRPF